MDRPKTKEEVIMHKKHAIRQLNNLCEKYIASNEPKLLKKVDLLSYWFEEYAKYIEYEEAFDSNRLIRYNRGDIVRVNFGFNIGKELGGLHLAVVLDKDNKRNADVLTVVPLSSTNGKNVHSRSVDLGRELFEKINHKHSKMLEDIQKQFSETNEAVIALSNTISLLEGASESQKLTEEYSNSVYNARNTYQNLVEREKNLEKNITILERNTAEIEQLKSGSMAVTNQITTISKQRIYVPKKAADFLYGISLSAVAMNKISNKIKELYFHE